MRKVLSRTRDYLIIWSVFLFALVVLLLCAPIELTKWLNRQLKKLDKHLGSLIDQAFAAGYAAQDRLKADK